MRHPETLTPKSKTHIVAQKDDHNYLVVSGTTGKEYTVTTLENGASCSCDWAKYRPADNHGRCGCSHVIAVLAFIETEKNRKLSAVHTTWASARKHHRKILDIGDGLLLTTRKVG